MTTYRVIDGLRVRVGSARDKWLRRTERVRRALLPGKPFPMYDSVTVSAIPVDAPAAACYTDGKYKNCGKVEAHVKTHRILGIAVFAKDDAHCLDIENGDALPAQAPEWVKRQHARDVKRPTVYANKSTMPSVLQALNKAGVRRHRIMWWRKGYNVWSADYTFHQHRCSPRACGAEFKADATQWNDHYHGKNLDASWCRGHFL